MMIVNVGGIIFVTSYKESDKYIEVLRAEHDLNNFRITINRTLKPVQYELYLDYELFENDRYRKFSQNLFGSRKLEKIANYISKNLI